MGAIWFFCMLMLVSARGSLLDTFVASWYKRGKYGPCSSSILVTSSLKVVSVDFLYI